MSKKKSSIPTEDVLATQRMSEAMAILRGLPDDFARRPGVRETIADGAREIRDHALGRLKAQQG